MCVAAAVLGLITAVVCSGCGFSSNRVVPDEGSPVIDAQTIDTAIVDATDAPPIPPDACVTFSRQLNTCSFALTSDLTISGAAVYNTDLRELRVAGQPVQVASTEFHTIATQDDPGNNVVAIFVHDLTIAREVELRAVGSLPLAIIAGGRVELEDGAAIDVSDGGAGMLAGCATPPMPGQTNASGAGGGGGGSFGGGGGRGGNGNEEGPQAPGGAGGGSVAMPPGLRGGCPGERGGFGSGNTVGAGGQGGGAIYIAAAVEIRIGDDAVIDAAGGGGRGGTRSGTPDLGNAGGGGGGSGGMIVFEAPRIVVATSARIAANGGGGGEGSTTEQAGNNGARGLRTNMPAPGGNNGPTDGADGGQGGARNNTSGQEAQGVRAGGGGGGGGGVGYIRVLSPDAPLNMNNVSPAPVRQ